MTTTTTTSESFLDWYDRLFKYIPRDKDDALHNDDAEYYCYLCSSAMRNDETYDHLVDYH